MKKLLLTLTLVICIAGCASQQKVMWNKAQQQNTRESYETYLTEFQDGDYAESAREKLAEIDIKEAARKNTREAYEAFVAKYPQSSFTPSAKERLAEFEYNDAVKQNSNEALQAFIDKHPDSQFADKAQQTIIKNEYDKAVKENSTEALQEFVALYPESSQAKQAKDKLIDIDFEEAGQQNTKQAWETFIAKYPDSRYYKKRAEDKIAQIDFDIAAEENTKAAYQDFIKKFPKSSLAQKAKDGIAFIDYEKAVSLNTKAAFEQFIKDNPKSKYTDTVKEKLAWLDPGVNFSPSKYFYFRLLKPNSPELSNWEQALDDYYYKKGKDKSYDALKEYAIYTTLNPNSKHKSDIFAKLFEKDNMSYSFDDNVNFLLFDEYVRRFPSGKKVKEVTNDKILASEKEYLKDIYLSKAVDRVLATAKRKGISEKELADLRKLKKEIVAFEKLDIKNETASNKFIKTYPSCKHNNLIRKYHFESYNTKYGATQDGKLVSKIVQWIPYDQSEEFYNNTWKKLNAEAQGKTTDEQIALLKPWLTTSDYRFVSMEEKVFLVDMLSWSANLQLLNEKASRTALSYMTAAAILHTVSQDLAAKLLTNMFSNLDFFNINAWKAQLQAKQAQAETARNNINAGRKLLYNLGIASFYAGSLEFLSQLANIQSDDEAENEKAIEAAKEKMMSMFSKDDVYRETCIKNLLHLFDEDQNCWPALQALTIFPDKRALEPIVLMPRFYDYEGDIEEYLDKFKKESIALANKWLTDKNATSFQKGRAMYILGYLKTPAKPPAKVREKDVGDLTHYYDYYHLRMGTSPRSKYLNRLIKTASDKNKIALVLYNRVRGDHKTPVDLKAWMIGNIKTKKYDDNQALHIYHGTIAGLSKADKKSVVDMMYNSYNMSWKDIASQYYPDMLPAKPTVSYINTVLGESIPWKKVDLINHLIDKKQIQHKDIIAKYLKGEYYTEGDRKLVRRNLENMFTKDITLGYNEKINWSVINSAVSKTEGKYKSIIISLASSGLDMLDFDQAVDVITTRFLTDDMLCVDGASWITKNYDAAKNKKPALSNVKTNTSLQKAVLAFLNAHFSDKQNYKEYISATKKLKSNDNWSQLVSLGTENIKDDSFKQDSEISSILDPVNNFSLDNLMNNIKSRYFLMVSSGQK